MPIPKLQLEALIDGRSSSDSAACSGQGCHDVGSGKYQQRRGHRKPHSRRWTRPIPQLILASGRL